jgi:hypothetical protein
MRFDIDTQDLTVGCAQRTALLEPVAEVAAPRSDRRVFRGKAAEPRNLRMSR